MDIMQPCHEASLLIMKTHINWLVHRLAGACHTISSFQVAPLAAYGDPISISAVDMRIIYVPSILGVDSCVKAMIVQ